MPPKVRAVLLLLVGISLLSARAAEAGEPLPATLPDSRSIAVDVGSVRAWDEITRPLKNTAPAPEAQS